MTKFYYSPEDDFSLQMLTWMPADVEKIDALNHPELAQHIRAIPMMEREDGRVKIGLMSKEEGLKWLQK